MENFLELLPNQDQERDLRRFSLLLLERLTQKKKSIIIA